MSNVSGDSTFDLTPRKGMDLRALGKQAGSPFIQNIIPRNGDLAVRSGFGLVYEYGTTLNCGRIDNPNANYGLGPCIGSTYVRTPWETDQILSIHTLQVFSASIYDRINDGVVSKFGDRVGQIIRGVVAVVHDLHTGRHFEFVLHYQDALTEDLQNVFPHYATRVNADFTKWATPAKTPEWAVFAPNSGNIVIAIDNLGLWTYRPVDCPTIVDRKVQNLDVESLLILSGETCAFSPLNLADGIFVEDGITYLREDEFGTVDAIGVWNDRIVYGVGPTLWFSDPNRPDTIIANNFYVLPTTDTITMIASLRGTLLVATSRQTWLFQPSTGDASTAIGSLTQISNGTGCLTNQSYVGADQYIIFSDAAGVYAYAGGISLKHLSEPIDRLWTDPQSLQMPLTDYYTQSGVTSLADPQPAARIDVRSQMESTRFAWYEDQKTLFCVCDDITLCWTEAFGWHVWSFETHAGAGDEVQASKNIAKPFFVPIGPDVYLIGGTDDTLYLSDDTRSYARDKSCYLLRLNRGGSIDRTADSQYEDDREPVGGWRRYEIDPVERIGSNLFIGRRIEAPPGFRTPTGQTVPGKTYWLPISVGNCSSPFSTWSIQFEFDNTLWSPILKGGGSAEFDFVLPSERIGSAGGYNPGAPIATNQVQLYNAGGVPDVNGDRVHINFDGAGGAWTTQPFINAGLIGPDPLIFLGFEYIGVDSSFAIPINFYSAIVQANNSYVYVWQEGEYPEQGVALENKQQPIDWVVKTLEVEQKGMQVRIRGVFLEAMHFGNGVNDVQPNWQYGPLNTATSTDMRDYTAQLFDFSSTPPGNSQQTDFALYPRMTPTTSLTDPTTKILNGTARWSSGASPETGNLLIDDASVDTLAGTDGSQGVRASIMTHGTMNSPSDGIRLGKIEAVVRIMGNRRRWR